MAFVSGAHHLFHAHKSRSGISKSSKSIVMQVDGGYRLSRRQFGDLVRCAALSAVVLGGGQKVNAISGLKIFPLSEPLTNSYYLMRAAESVSDARGVAHSNPVDKLSINLHGLTPRGVEQAIRAAEALREDNVEYDLWIWPSTATNAMETAEVLAYELNVRREQIVPEFSFLDARGLGVLEGKPQKYVMEALEKLDGVDVERRPEPTDDGTPNDSVADVFVRVRQLLSKLETQYFGERIVIIAPDSHPLSILQAALMDVDLASHHNLTFKPGELRKVKEKVVDRISGKEVDPVAEVLSKA